MGKWVSEWVGEQVRRIGVEERDGTGYRVHGAGYMGGVEERREGCGAVLALGPGLVRERRRRREERREDCTTGWGPRPAYGTGYRVQGTWVGAPGLLTVRAAHAIRCLHSHVYMYTHGAGGTCYQMSPLVDEWTELCLHEVCIYTCGTHKTSDLVRMRVVYVHEVYIHARAATSGWSCACMPQANGRGGVVRRETSGLGAATNLAG